MVQQIYRDSVDLAFRSAAWGVELLARGVGAAARMLPDAGKEAGSRKRRRKTPARRSTSAAYEDERDDG